MIQLENIQDKDKFIEKIYKSLNVRLAFFYGKTPDEADKRKGNIDSKFRNYHYP